MKHRYKHIYKKFKSATPDQQLKMVEVLNTEMSNLEELLSKMCADLIGCSNDN